MSQRYSETTALPLPTRRLKRSIVSPPKINSPATSVRRTESAMAIPPLDHLRKAKRTSHAVTPRTRMRMPARENASTKAAISTPAPIARGPSVCDRDESHPACSRGRRPWRCQTGRRSDCDWETGRSRVRCAKKEACCCERSRRRKAASPTIPTANGAVRPISRNGLNCRDIVNPGQAGDQVKRESSVIHGCGLSRPELEAEIFR